MYLTIQPCKIFQNRLRMQQASGQAELLSYVFCFEVDATFATSADFDIARAIQVFARAIALPNLPNQTLNILFKGNEAPRPLTINQFVVKLVVT